MLGEVICLIGEVGGCDSDPAEDGGGSLLGEAINIVLRTSRRPRIVPAFRLAPVCGARCTQSKYHTQYLINGETCY